MSTFTLTATDLRDWLQPAIACACTDGALPVLNAVQLERNGPILTATATDRFRAGICMHRLPAKSKAKGAALIALDGLKQALAVLGPGRRRHDDREITVSITKAGASFAGKLHGLDVVVSFDLPNITKDVPATTRPNGRTTRAYTANEFPTAIGKVIGRACTRQPDHDGDAVTVDSVGLNIDLLAGFKAAVRDRNATVEFVTPTGPGKPYGIIVGDHFRGALMPRKLLREFTYVSPERAADDKARAVDAERAWAAVLTPAA